MSKMEESKKNIKFLEQEISDLYSKIALLEAEKQVEEEYLQSLCPHNRLAPYGHGQDQCLDCGKTGL